jgi:cytochrome c553
LITIIVLALGLTAWILLFNNLYAACLDVLRWSLLSSCDGVNAQLHATAANTVRWHLMGLAACDACHGCTGMDMVRADFVLCVIMTC